MEHNRLIITLFGATGDLAARKLYPAFYQLYKKGQLSNQFALIGTARREWTDDYFRQIVLESIQNHVTDKEHAEEFISHFFYQPHDVTQAEHYHKLNNLADKLEVKFDTGGNRIFYISLSPNLFPVITRNLKEEKLLSENGYNRLIIEKPFGNDYDSALKLQKQLEKTFDENQIYRIDHYLGKSIVNQIPPLRFNNPLIEHIWTKEIIDHVQITLDESIGIEERGAFYEENGVSKDMIQNHALQLLALLAMRQPKSNDSEDVRHEKIRVLENLRHYQDQKDIDKNVVRGQYGPSEDGQLNAYREEENVASDSITETYIAQRIDLNLPEWEGIPFYIRSGKRLAEKVTVINLVFKRDNPELAYNFLQIEISPKSGVRLSLTQNDSTFIVRPIEMLLHYKITPEELAEIPGDYEKLILDCMYGNLNNFTHWLEVAAAWKFIDQIHSLWQAGPEPDFPNYPSLSDGPEEAESLLVRDNRYWI